MESIKQRRNRHMRSEMVSTSNVNQWAVFYKKTEKMFIVETN